MTTFRIVGSLLLAALFTLLAAPLFAEATPSAPATFPTKWAINGYVQGRYTTNFGENTAPSSFNINRTYINVRVDVSPHVGAGMLVGGVSAPVVYEAYADYKFSPDLKARIGLYRAPFGYETSSSSSRLITLERSQVIQILMYRDFTFDRGLYAYYTPVDSKFNVSAAITNGTFLKSALDTDKRKNLIVRAGYALPGGQVGVSVLTGLQQQSRKMDRTGVDLQTQLGEFTIQSEAVIGCGLIANFGTPAENFVNNKAKGAYLTVAYQQKESKYQPYLRYDIFNQNVDAGGQNYHRLTAGLNYMIDKASKLTAEYQNINDDLNPNVNGALGLQYQISF